MSWDVRRGAPRTRLSGWALSKGDLGLAMLEQAFAADTPCKWVTADSVYGGTCRLRRTIAHFRRGD
jgi:SRSO17 transposase